MKEVVGYLLNRSDGSGVASKVVDFLLLDGTPVPATASSVYTPGASGTVGTITRGSKDTVTDANGRFSAWWELSPGPVNIEVAASGAPTPEEKARKWDERAQLGYQWSSDISRLGRGIREGVVRGFLNELAVQVDFPGSHTVRVKTGAAIVNGLPFTIENGYIDVAGTPNTNPALTPRLDLVSLRQYSETATGQLAGKQDIVITLGTSSNVAPATPVGSDFRDIPLFVIETAYNGTTKTIAANGDKRVFPIPSTTGPTTLRFMSFWAGPTKQLTSTLQDTYTIPCTGLSPGEIYDGMLYLAMPLWFTTNVPSGLAQDRLMVDFEDPVPKIFATGPFRVGDVMGFSSGNFTKDYNLFATIPFTGLTGVASKTFTVKMKMFSGGAPMETFLLSGGMSVAELIPR